MNCVFFKNGTEKIGKKERTGEGPFSGFSESPEKGGGCDALGLFPILLFQSQNAVSSPAGIVEDSSEERDDFALSLYPVAVVDEQGDAELFSGFRLFGFQTDLLPGNQNVILCRWFPSSVFFH